MQAGIAVEPAGGASWRRGGSPVGAEGGRQLAQEGIASWRKTDSPAGRRESPGGAERDRQSAHKGWRIVFVFG